MTTKLAGGKITGLLALTLEAQVALEIGDPVMVTGDYECGLADGTKPVVGFCTVANKGTTNTIMSRTVGTPVVPGDVTVDVRGYMVRTITSGGAFAAGVGVGIDAAGDLVADGAGVAHVGVALLASTGAGERIDVLVD
jgi:hypothetical protein